MTRTIFLAGAAGAIGTRLVPLLRGAGYAVVGTTRSTVRAAALAAAGVTPVVVDVFDAAALARAVAHARPEIAIHQLTDLPPGLDPGRMADAIANNARIRIDGTRHLIAACLAAGVRRVIAQSVAWLYAPGPQPYAESHPLDRAAEGSRAVTVGGVEALERAVLESPPIEGVVLRYGQLYGPGTGADEPRGQAPVHVDAAAHAALLAIDKARSGVYNIAEPLGLVAIDKARRELGWDPAFRNPDRESR
jgi:nucleoside-diphosphate-sugar epimerase